ncbi:MULTISPECIES: phage holin family protein [unclassified Duganella]|uniref:phage holin family protein n=1 Tax=unclassified Duganella TaxID=2636909 RepID=UPI000E34F579|nr:MULTISPECIES: phage holin family protein [unclassified Duganella]RFP15866.1 phage holin family protein [Duganella sp. BJB475]RFP32970.1 phage holin family protein [Duganella sp. BJB476]
MNRPPGLIASLGNIARNSIGLVLTRLELAALELSQVRNHLLQLVLVFALAVVAGCFALAYGTVTIAYLAWDSIGWKILPIITGVFLLIAIGLILYARGMIRSGKLSMPATMAELKSDRDMLL